jgi:hypothetical protein
MTKFELLGLAAILSTVIATPVLAEDPLQAEEPGLWSFYHPGEASGTAGAMASVRNSGSSASAPARHYARASAKRYARAQAAATR